MSKQTTQNGYLSRDAILGASDIEYREMVVPEWGGTIRLKGMTGKERDAFEASVTEQRGKGVTVGLKNLRARLVAMTAVDAAGNRLFSDADVVLLGNKSARALSRVAEATAKLSRLSDEDMDELAGESESDQD